MVPASASRSAIRSGSFSNRRRTPDGSRRCSSCFPTPASCTSSAIPTRCTARRSSCGRRSTSSRPCKSRSTRDWKSTSFRCFERMYERFERDRAAGRSGAILRSSLRGPGAKPDRADAGAVRAPGAGRVRDGAAQAGSVLPATARTIAPAPTRSPTSCATRSTAAGDRTCASTATVRPAATATAASPTAQLRWRVSGRDRLRFSWYA